MRGARAAGWLFLVGALLCVLLWRPGIAAATGSFHFNTVQRDVVYTIVDGVALKMDIYYPRDALAPSPAVIYIHGGGWYSGDKTSGPGIEDIPGLINSGYLVASINYRLAPRYQFPTQIEDVKSAVRYLRSNSGSYNIDPARIGLVGDSAGAHLAALAGVAADECAGSGAKEGDNKVSDRVQAVVDMFGPVDLALFYQRNYSLNIEHVFSTDDPLSPVIKNASPVMYVSPDDPPFLILHGDSDTVVSLEQSVLMYRCLEAAGVPADLAIVGCCGHGFEPVGGALSPGREQITRLIVDFLDKSLKGRAD